MKSKRLIEKMQKVQKILAPISLRELEWRNPYHLGAGTEDLLAISIFVDSDNLSFFEQTGEFQ